MSFKIKDELIKDIERIDVDLENKKMTIHTRGIKECSWFSIKINSLGRYEIRFKDIDMRSNTTGRLSDIDIDNTKELEKCIETFLTMRP